MFGPIVILYVPNAEVGTNWTRSVVLLTHENPVMDEIMFEPEGLTNRVTSEATEKLLVFMGSLKWKSIKETGPVVSPAGTDDVTAGPFALRNETVRCAFSRPRVATSPVN
jgi:hypothetical protein